MKQDATPFDPLLLDFSDRFESERLLLRAPRPGDGQTVYEGVVETLDDLRRIPSSMAWAQEPPAVEKQEAFCRRGAASWILRTDLPLLLFRRSDQAHVGNCGLHRFDWQTRVFEIGWWCRKPYQGQGFITEAARATIEFSFTHLGARRVWALADEANDKSWRVAERAGLIYEGTLKSERADPDGTRRDMRVYAITR